MMRLFFLLLTLTPGGLWAETVTVFAAASMKSALDDAAETFTEKTDLDIALSFAGSSVLARQIGFGAPADLFISANSAWMDVVDAQGLVVRDSRVDLAGNDLALIARTNGAWQAGASLPAGRIAMALVDAVPAGIYGKQALQSLGLWDDAASRVVQTDNVRMALALVALGEVPLGIVYASDADAEPRVRVLGVFPPDSHDPIRYPAALIAPGTEAARAFLDFLKSDDGRAIFVRHGFTDPPGLQ